MNRQKHIMKFEKKSAIVSKKDLTVNLYKMKLIKKIKMNFYNGKINTNFGSDKILKEGYQCISLW